MGGWVSAVTAARAAATRWPPTSHPTAKAGLKGKGRSRRTPGEVRAVGKRACSGGGLSERRSGHSESHRWGKKRSSAASGRRRDRSRPHAGAVSRAGPFLPLPGNLCGAAARALARHYRRGGGGGRVRERLEDKVREEWREQEGARQLAACGGGS